MAQKPSIPKGTRDFNPDEVAKRDYIFNVIKQQFETFGFQPIETPSFENSETLMGKYGEEGDRLIFRILDSGEFFEKNQSKIINSITLTICLEKTIITTIKKVNNQLGNEKYYIKSELEKILKDENFKKSFYNIFKKNLTQFNIKDKPLRNKILNSFISISFLEDYLFDYLLSLSSIEKADKLTGIGKFSFELIHDRILKNINELIKPKSFELSKKISTRALRYDLTVPFARYVVQHQNEITFPFKRYQIQPVWRADRPQKGRFREFYQCDADVVGSTSLWQEVEFVQLYDAVFTALKLEGVTIKINNRKILSGIAEVIGAQDKLIDFTVALDKLDKIGEEKVKDEMLSKGISQSGIDKLQPLFSLKGSFGTQIEQLKSILSASEEGKKGIQELEFINTSITELGLQTASLELDVTLARGLNYYTGAIYEVSAPKGVDMGSIGGGGRYDDLTGIFGLKDVSGVGISFGLDRIYLVLEALDLFPITITNTVKVLFVNFGATEALSCMKAIKALRSNGISAELYPDEVTSGKQMKKQMNYANKRAIEYVVLVGEEELKTNMFTLKNMTSGDQQQLDLQGLISTLE